ncbi:Serine/threonine-protein kinase [Coemansia sp. RSA 2049]|nr:Serine/threonine-protein kinase [Coemansia sp. RSA 1939]KAJ2523548.1 Serine/threonine-protein kinase [Coemansia sp. RSA 2049]KAJ2617331.1 Serine/threonine-protein kinase [Coemansia sp. RSA 1804]KAJ2695171.1 Serine/threonine-protein kinase [Coemansia sp. RSA 1285]
MKTCNINSSLFDSDRLDGGQLEFSLNLEMLKSAADADKDKEIRLDNGNGESGKGRRRLFAKLGANNCRQQSAQPQPQRNRSLMFRPILDVAGVGALIDTITRRDEEQAASELATAAETTKPRVFLGSLRRGGGGKAYGAQVRKAPMQIQLQQTISPPGNVLAASNLTSKKAVAASEALDDEGPGIALSLKSSRSRRFLLHTPLGEYEVERTLGQGSYGKVKLMRSALTGERVAVKIIRRFAPHKRRRGHAEYRKARTLDRRVVREANLASILGGRHPGIVPLTDFRVTDTHFYLFYAFVEGETLAERIGSSGLSETEARGIFRGVAEAIAFCHAHSVIHRDIKLENVMVARGSGQARLIDFGLANFFDGASLMETFCGSLPYTAPEILRGDAYVGPEVDVWSLGVLLYVTLCGRFPFEDPAQPRNYDRIMAADYALRADMSAPLRDLLARMLEPAVARRIAMADILTHPWVADGAPAGAPAPPAHGPRLSRRCLPLPGPRVDMAAVRETAVCLDRSADDVTRILETAMARGAVRRRGAHTIVDVPNSPVVSVYALVLHQMRRRRQRQGYIGGVPPASSLAARATGTTITATTSSTLAVSGAASMPLLPLRSGGRSRITASPLRAIGAMDDVQRRIALPAALAGAAPFDVMERLSALLALHEIAHTYVEPRVGSAEHNGYSSGVVATAATTATGSNWSWTLSWMDGDCSIEEDSEHGSSNNDDDNTNINIALNIDNDDGHAAASNKHDARRWSSRLYRMLSRSQPLGKNADGCNGSKNQANMQKPAPSQPDQPNTAVPSSSSSSAANAANAAVAADDSACVAVKHTTCVLLAQYSPSLSRSREAEILEYYSCSVRIELVRVAAGPASLRRRYALLVDRMAGHKGKFALFRTFLQRMASEI